MSRREPPDKEIHTRDYDGPERRIHAPNGRRPSDAITRSLPILGILAALTTSAVSAGISYGTTKNQLASIEKSKVDRTEWIQANAEQDRQREELREIVIGLRGSLESVAPQVKELNDRLKQFYCEGKGPTCR